MTTRVTAGLTAAFLAAAVPGAVAADSLRAAELAGAEGVSALYTIDVPPGAARLLVSTAGGDGDINLYVRYAAAPAPDAYTARATGGGSQKSVEIAAPAAGEWQILLAAGSAYSGITLSAASRSLATLAEIRADILARVNAERQLVSRQPLRLRNKLNRAAQRHARDMAINMRTYLDHTGTDGTSAGDRITQAGYTWTAWAENIAAGQSTAAAVMAAWMASSGHRANILGAAYRHLGVGYKLNTATVYDHWWCQDFARP